MRTSGLCRLLVAVATSGLAACVSDKPLYQVTTAGGTDGHASDASDAGAPGDATADTGGGRDTVVGDGARDDAGPDGAAGSGCGAPQVAFTPLFTSTATQATPVSFTDPTTGHLIFRGAGRVRAAHETDDGYASFPPNYAEDRTFGYVLDDGIPAGGTTITITVLTAVNQAYTKQTLASQQQGLGDLTLRVWKVYGGVDGHVFAGNFKGGIDFFPDGCVPDPNAASCNTRKWTYSITTNDREHRPIQLGDQLQIELNMWLSEYGAGQGPPVDASHIRNLLPLPQGCTLNGPPFTNGCYTQSFYAATDSFRYVVGNGRLTPANLDCTLTVPLSLAGTAQDFPHPYDCSATGPIAAAVAAGSLKDRTGPAPAGWSGGTATVPYLRGRHDLYYAQMAPSTLVENVDDFVQGRRLFHIDFTSGVNTEADNVVSDAETAVHAGLAGPLYNEVSCAACHVHNNRGGTAAAGPVPSAVVLRLGGAGRDVHGGPTGDPTFGHALQTKAGAALTAEGAIAVQTSTKVVTFADGAKVTLTKPAFAVTVSGGGAAPAQISPRLAPPLIGLGLLEAVPEADILARADPQDCDGDGIRGAANLVFDPEDGTTKVGRFGWKASKASLKHQVAETLLLDVGVTSSVFPKLDCGASQTACLAAASAAPELSDHDMAQLITYMRDGAVPPRRDLTDAAVVRGEALFTQVGCAACHTTTLQTGNATPFVELRGQTIHPYTDLLLHDLGADLADSSSGEYVATGSQWRTSPLWGIGVCDEVAAGASAGSGYNLVPAQGPCHYLHDGRAATLLEAILWHGGEAAHATSQVLALPAADRDALVAFLQSL